MEDDLTKLSVDELFDRIGQRSPAPGGGSVAALAGALSCALARMVAAYTVSRKSAPEPREQAEAAVTHLSRCGQLLRALVTQDAEAYVALSAASKAAGSDPGTSRLMEEAAVGAAAVPMETAAVVSDALARMDEIKTLVGKNLLSDLGIAAVVAEAAARAAEATVRVNLPQLPEATKREAFCAELDRILEHCRARRDSITRFVGERLKPDSASSR